MPAVGRPETRPEPPHRGRPNFFLAFMRIGGGAISRPASGDPLGLDWESPGNPPGEAPGAFGPRGLQRSPQRTPSNRPRRPPFVGRGLRHPMIACVSQVRTHILAGSARLRLSLRCVVSSQPAKRFGAGPRECGKTWLPTTTASFPRKFGVTDGLLHSRARYANVANDVNNVPLHSFRVKRRALAGGQGDI
jgi:hypothetical protein